MTTDDINGTLEMEDEAVGGQDPSLQAAADSDESESLLTDLSDAVPNTGNLDMLLDVGLKITVELGRTRLKFREVLESGQRFGGGTHATDQRTGGHPGQRRPAGHG